MVEKAFSKDWWSGAIKAICGTLIGAAILWMIGLSVQFLLASGNEAHELSKDNAVKLDSLDYRENEHYKQNLLFHAVEDTKFTYIQEQLQRILKKLDNGENKKDN